MGHGHSHNGQKCHGHGQPHGLPQLEKTKCQKKCCEKNGSQQSTTLGHGHGQHTMTYEQAMSDPILRARIKKQMLRKKRIQLFVRILSGALCVAFFWFYGKAIDEYLDPPKDHKDAVQARLRSAQIKPTLETEVAIEGIHEHHNSAIAIDPKQHTSWEHSNEKSKKFLEEYASHPGVNQLNDGVMFKVLSKGNGKLHPTLNSPCLTHYEGKLPSGVIFDSSYARGKPNTFAPNQVIKGWTEILLKMVEGDIWEVVIPSDLGYGSRGTGHDIKGGDTLIFKINLIKIKGDKIDH